MRFIKPALVLAMLILSVDRNYDWGTVVRIWTDAAIKSPQKHRPRHGIFAGHFFRDEFDPGITAIHQAMKELKDPPIELWQEEGNVYLKQQKYHEAQAVFGEAIQREPSSLGWQNMGSAWYQEWLHGNKDPHLLWLAAEAYSLALQYDSSNGWVVNDWADVYFYANRYVPEAQYLFTVNRTLDGTEAYVLGKWMLNSGNAPGAATLFHLACQTKDWTICHFYEGYAQQMAGKYPEAIKAYKETLRRDAQLREARYNLGMVYEAAGMKEESDESYREAQLVKN